MKTIHYFGLFAPILVLLALFTVVGCKTPEPVVKIETVVREVQVPVSVPPDTITPLTPSILVRLRDSGDDRDVNERIKRYQFRLNGRIGLEREHVVYNDSLLPGGVVKFENMHVRDSVIINDQSDGQALAVRATRNEITLHVCFESDDKYQLVFYADGDDPDGFFYLDYTPNVGRRDEKGSLVYGGESYILRYGDRRPYLLINLSQRDTEMLNSRTAAGRKVD